jgi:hypothetical protein
VRILVKPRLAAIGLLVPLAGLGIAWTITPDSAPRGGALTPNHPVQPEEPGAPPPSVQLKAMVVPSTRSIAPAPHRSKNAETRLRSPAQDGPSGGSKGRGRDGRNVRVVIVRSGRVVLELSPAGARLVSASPNPGVRSQVWHQTTWLRVELTDGTHGSSVIASWNGHPPLIQTYEY